MTIWAHTLVKNEERYLWFSVASVIDHIDKLLLWDTGSTDNTVKIAKELVKKFGNKIDFREVGEVDTNKFTEVRQEMLKATKSDWFIIVDGDEIWWDEYVRKLRVLIRERGEDLDSIGCRYYNLVGDMYHYQDEKAGKYKIDDNIGHLTLRAFNRSIGGLHFGKPHGQQGIFDRSERLVQDLPKDGRYFIDSRTYLHFTHLPRSGESEKDRDVPKREKKLKHELGAEFPLDFYYPEVFFREKSVIVQSPWTPMDRKFIFKSHLQTPFRKLKRRFVDRKSGY